MKLRRSKSFIGLIVHLGAEVLVLLCPRIADALTSPGVAASGLIVGRRWESALVAGSIGIAVRGRGIAGSVRDLLGSIATADE
jgi:hypothetical protein